MKFSCALLVSIALALPQMAPSAPTAGAPAAAPANPFAERLQADLAKLEKKPAVQQFLKMKDSITQQVQSEAQALSSDSSFGAFKQAEETFVQQLVQQGQSPALLQALMDGTVKTTGNQELDASFA